MRSSGWTLCAPSTTALAPLAASNGTSFLATARFAAFSFRFGFQLLTALQSVCDWPAIAFVKELVEAYPEAKVILTTRDVDSWHA